jgi:hypothetical protein
MCGGEEGERGRISRMKDPELEGTRRDGYMLTAELSFVDIRSHERFTVICGVQARERKLGTPCQRRGDGDGDGEGADEFDRP